MTNEVAIEILEMLKIRPRRGSSMIIAQTAVNVALQTGINALYEKKDRIEKADNDLSSGTRKNSKKLEKGNDLAVDCNNCKNNCYRGDETSYCATSDGMCHYECEEPRKGHWIKVTYNTGRLVCECDRCGWQQKLYTNFCPNCGADMREVEE